MTGGLALIGAAVSAVALLCSLVFIYEVWTAPTLDADGHVIADPHGRLGTPFDQGDPVPPEHEGKRYA